MKILITGAGGLVGTHLSSALATDHQVVPLRHRDLDIADGSSVRQLMQVEQPALIINCAVVGVDECERHSNVARSINVSGPRNLAESASEIYAEFLHFSSNCVFDGARTDEVYYTVSDIPRPINVYGKTKLEGEQTACA